MRLPDSSPPRLLVLGLLVAACAISAAIGATSACLTDPPPDLPLVEQPPKIDDTAAITPPEGTITGLPPDGFMLVISVADPTQPCQWSVYDSESNQQPWPCTPCGKVESNGKVPVNFSISGATFNPALCHHIVFAVGSTFADPQCLSGGSDVAHWDYEPPNASCTSYDASALGDGAFPEAGSDALPVTGGDL